MTTKKLILDPTLPDVQNYQTLVSEIATNSTIKSACDHYGISWDTENPPLARLRLAVLFAGAAPPQDEPKWLTDLLPLFQRQAWKSHASIKQWAQSYFGEAWEPAHTIAFSIGKAVEMMLTRNGVPFDYRGPEAPRRPEREPAAELPAKPTYNVVNCFSELLKRDLSQHPLMGKKKTRERQKTDWVEAHYSAPALAAMGLRARDALYSQEEARLRRAFMPFMVAKRDSVWIAQQLDIEGVKVSGRPKANRTAKLLPWGIAIAGLKGCLPIDLLVAFTVSRSISQAALSGEGRDHEKSAPAPSRPRRRATRASKRPRPLESDDEPPMPARRRRRVIDDDDDDDNDDEDEDDGDDDDGDNRSAVPKTLIEAFLDSHQVRQLLNDPNPSKSKPGPPNARAKFSPHGVKTLLTGPRTVAFKSFVKNRCKGYSAKYPLGLRYERDGGPPFDPNEYAGRAHPAVSPDLCFLFRERERERLRRDLPASE